MERPARFSSSRRAVTVAFLLAGLGLHGTRAAAQLTSSSLHTAAPCRLIDTRQPAGQLGGPALAAGATRAFAVMGRCQIPLTAVAISVNVTVVAPAAAGHLRLFGSGQPMPETSTINYVAGQTRANNAIVALGADGAFVVDVRQASGTTDMVVDVTGYFGTSDCFAHTPASPLLGINTGDRMLSWPEVYAATSYDLYVKPVPGMCGLLPFPFVTRADQKVSGVTSPYDVSGFNLCGFCYFVDAVAVSGDCESPLRSDIGLTAPLGFSLYSCDRQLGALARTP